MVTQTAVETFMRLYIGSSGNQRLLTALVLLACLLCILQPASAKTYGVVVAGLGGNVEYSESFAHASEQFATGLRTLESDPSLVITLDESATRESILEAIEKQANRMTSDAADAGAPNQAFALVLNGHGNADKQGWRFNVAGPDLTSDDLVAALNAVPVQQQLVVLAASASGAALDTLSQLGRVLVTATKSGGEINAVRFPGFLAQAMQSDVADYDRNEILTIAEAYRFAEARTREYYEQQKLLASEHSRLRGDEADNIAIALLGSLQDASDDPLVAGLLDQRLTLEQRFKALRVRKPDMPVDEYYNELETLLLSIARLQQSIDEATGWSESDGKS